MGKHVFDLRLDMPKKGLKCPFCKKNLEKIHAIEGFAKALENGTPVVKMFYSCPSCSALLGITEGL